MVTNSQKKAIDRLRRQCDDSLLFSDKFENKAWDISETDYGAVWVSFEYGLKGDEGTLAEIFARDRGNVVIGKRGGIAYWVSKTMKDGSIKHYKKRYDGITPLSVVIDQR